MFTFESPAFDDYYSLYWNHDCYSLTNKFKNWGEVAVKSTEELEQANHSS